MCQVERVYEGLRLQCYRKESVTAAPLSGTRSADVLCNLGGGLTVISAAGAGM